MADNVESGEKAAEKSTWRSLLHDRNLRNVLLISCGMAIGNGGASVIGVVAEVVVQSMHEQGKYGFQGNEGYISFAIFSITQILGTSFFPAIAGLVGLKLAFVLGGFAFIFWTSAFVFPSPWFMYTMAFLFGFGLNVLSTASVALIAKYSTSEAESSRNFGIQYSITSCSWIWSSLFVSIEFAHRTRIDDATRLRTFGSLLVTSIIGVIIMATVPSPPPATEKPAQKTLAQGLKESFVLPLYDLTSRPILLLLPMILYCGLQGSFFKSVYPTAVGFDLHLGDSAASLAGVVGLVGAGVGGLVGGAICGPLTKFIGRRNTVLFGLALQFLAFAITITSLPLDSSLHKSDGPTLVPAIPALIVLGGLLLGIGDALFVVQMLTLIRDCFSKCGDESDRRTANGFAIQRLVRAVAQAVLFFAATKIGLQYHIGIFAVVGVAAAGSFILADVEFRRGRYSNI